MSAAIISAFLLILLKNPIHSIFSLLVSVIFSVFILFLNKVEFMAYIFLIVYIGAIAILFLFVIMMLNIKISSQVSMNSFIGELFLLLPIILKFAYSIKNILESYNVDFDMIEELGLKSNIIYENDIDIFSNLLYTQYSFIFILASIVLLVSMIGALIITTNKNLHK
jgi:NADH-quinone oxidoreductase subunit J